MEIGGRQPRKERIRRLVCDSGVAMTPANIRAALHRMGDHCSEQVIVNALTQLVREDMLTRPERGVYAPPAS